MSVAMDKAKISGIAGVVGAITALVTGNIQYLIIGGFGLFFLTLMIQYGSIKIKAVMTLTGGIGFALMYIKENGITGFLQMIGINLPF